MKLLFTLIAVLFTALPVQADAAECVSQADMQDIASHFTQFKDLAGKDYCYDGSPTANLIAGIMFMRETQFNLPMQKSKDELFSGRFASNWYNYFIGRINEMEIDTNCPKGVGAYVYAFGGRTMYVCTMILTDNFTALDRASIFMHEARHIDGYPHITCRSGPRAGLQGACDNRISDGGSYAVSVETYAQLARHALAIHPALKAYARASAVTYAAETFETPARVNSVQQFVALTSDKQFHQVKVDGATSPMGSAPATGKIVMRGQHMILFPTDKNLTARYVFARDEGEIAQQAGDIASEYNARTPADRANLIGAHIAAQWNAQIFKDKMKFACDPRANTFKDIAVGADKPVAVVYPNGYDRASKQAFLTMESGKLMEIGCNGAEPYAKAATISLDQKYKSIYKAGNLVLGLTMDGNLREIQGASSRPFSLGGDIDGKIVELAPNQLIEFLSER